MAWNDKGDARAKRYAAYQQLEAHYQAAVEALNVAKEEIGRKDALIRALAAELSAMRPEAETDKQGPDKPESGEVTVPPTPTPPPELKSAPYLQYPPVRPGLAKAQLRGRTIAERLEELQKIMASHMPEESKNTKDPKDPKAKG